MKIHRLAIIAGIVAAFALGAALAVAVALASASASTSGPPQCFTVRIVQAAPLRSLWVRFCGTGPAGTSPLEEGVAGHGPLIVDGADLTPGDCPRVAPCVILWPNSPQS